MGTDRRGSGQWVGSRQAADLGSWDWDWEDWPPGRLGLPDWPAHGCWCAVRVCACARGRGAREFVTAAVQPPGRLRLAACRLE